MVAPLISYVMYFEGSGYGDIIKALNGEGNRRSVTTRESVSLAISEPLLKYRIISSGDGLLLTGKQEDPSKIYVKLDCKSSSLKKLTASTKYSAMHHISKQYYDAVLGDEFLKQKMNVADLSKKDAKKHPLLTGLLGRPFLDSLVETVYGSKGEISIFLGNVPEMQPDPILRPFFVKKTDEGIEFHTDLDMSQYSIMPTILETNDSEISRFVL